VCSHGHTYKFLKEHIEDKDIIALNLGSGNSNISSNVTNIDIFAYPNVDVACNIENLPFKDGSVDVILSIAVLEHLASPEKVVSEMNRVLKANGIVYCFFPFIQGFHASPHDYSRRTLEGMKVLFIDFEQIDLKPSGGPTSGLLWVLQEWLAMIFSLGIKPLYHIFLFLSMVLTFPLKFLDLFLIKHPVAGNISSGFVYIGRKREMVDSRTSR
jgi:SAM-dependent methyltransferase